MCQWRYAVTSLLLAHYTHHNYSVSSLHNIPVLLGSARLCNCLRAQEATWSTCSTVNTCLCGRWVSTHLHLCFLEKIVLHKAKGLHMPVSLVYIQMRVFKHVNNYEYCLSILISLVFWYSMMCVCADEECGEGGPQCHSACDGQYCQLHWENWKDRAERTEQDGHQGWYVHMQPSGWHADSFTHQQYACACITNPMCPYSIMTYMYVYFVPRKQTDILHCVDHVPVAICTYTVCSDPSAWAPTVLESGTVPDVLPLSRSCEAFLQSYSLSRKQARQSYYHCFLLQVIRPKHTTSRTIGTVSQWQPATRYTVSDYK